MKTTLKMADVRKSRRELWCLCVLWGGPLFFAMITWAAIYLLDFYFTWVAAKLIGGINAILAFGVTGIAGAFYDSIEAPIAKRVFRAIGFATIGLLLYSIAVAFDYLQEPRF